MFKKLRAYLFFFGFFVSGLVLFATLVFGDLYAVPAMDHETGIFFETMEVDTSNVSLRGFVDTTTSFASGGTLKISFVDSGLGDWCKAATVPLTVIGIEVPWPGSLALPGTLAGTCYQHSNGDYIEITGIGTLYESFLYGFEITKHANLSTGPDLGNNRVLLEVSSGSAAQSKLFSIYLMSNDKVQIVAEVLDAGSLICTISKTALPLGILSKGGAYSTANHKIGTSTTGSSRGYYWTVFGYGDGTIAGLKSSNYLIKSLNNTVNLLTGEGFGLVVSPNSGASVPSDFATGSRGTFGSIKSGLDNVRMIMYRTSEQTEHKEATVIIGARASSLAEAGGYTETLTYSCGAYIGGYRPLDLLVTPTTLNFGTTEEMKMFTISNSGTGTLEWEIGETIYASGAGWITDVNPVAGKSRSSEDSVAVNVDRELLSIGNYEATIPVISLGGGNQNVTIRLEKLASLLQITTKNPYDIATTSAKSGGNITNDGGSPVIARGVCYGTLANPTTPCTSNGIGTGEFVSEMTSLNLGTRYYVRAYGENNEDITYGDEFNFITLSTISANPESRDWGNTDVEATITAIGSDIPQIDYCWTVENTCAPDTFVVENPTNVTQAQHGSWNLCYRYRDADGKKSNTFCSGPYKIDKIEPELSATNSSETWYNSQRTATVSATDTTSGIAEVRYNWGADLMNVACTAGGTVTSHSAELNAPAGGATLYLCTRDNAGNVNTWSGAYNWTGIEPSVGASEIYSGNSHNNTHFNGTISLQSSVTDQGGAGLDETSCEVSINGGNWFATGVTYVTGYCQYNNYTPNADFTIRFRISDNAENVGTSSLGSFTYDNTAPTTTATMTSPVGGTAYTCGEFTAENVRAVLSCADNVGGSGCEATYPKYCTDATNTCTPATSYSTNVDITTEGTTYIRYFSSDNLTNNETVQSCEIKIDKTAPINGSFVINNNDTYTTSQTGNTLNVTCPTDSWTPIQMAYGNVIDPTTPWDTCAATVSNYSLTAGDGTKTVYMRFRDGGLNITDNITDTIILDTVNPSIAASNANATWYSTERTATVSATDATSGIAEVRYNWGSSSVLNSNCDTLGTATTNGAILSAPSGGTNLYLCARDNAGNTNTWSGEYNWKYEQSTAVTTGGCTSTIWGTNCTVTAAGGDGTGSYEFEKVSGDTCSINSTTGVVSSTGAGTCVVRARRLSDNNYYTSSWSTNHSITLNKQEQSAPTAPTCSTVTENSVTITGCTGCEYRRGTGTAQGSTLFTGLSSSTTYTFSRRYVATADYNVSPWSSNVSCTTLAPPHACGDNITDSRDSQVYPTVEIGTQCWTAKNLAYLPSVVGPATGSTTIPYYYVHGYDGTDVSAAKATDNYTTYGVLYNWPAAMDGDTLEGSQGICPTGWHLPSDAEQHTLDAYLATGTCDPARTAWGCDPAGTKMKTAAWGGDNTSGFTALAGGYRNTNGSFSNLGTAASFWSSSSSGSNAWNRNLHSSDSTVYRGADAQAHGFSVRCLRN